MLLFAFMFFDWFGVESSDDSFGLFDVGRSAWEALEVVPVLLLIAIAATLVGAMLRVINVSPRVTLSATAMVAVMGAISALAISVCIVDPPNFGSFGTAFGTVTYEGTVKLPIFFALAAAVGMAYGGWRAIREEGISCADRGRVDERDR